MQEFTMTIVDRETHFRAPEAGGTVQILSRRQGGDLYETLFERRGMGAAEHAGPGELERVVRRWAARNHYTGPLPETVEAERRLRAPVDQLQAAMDEAEQRHGYGSPEHEEARRQYEAAYDRMLDALVEMADA